MEELKAKISAIKKKRDRDIATARERCNESIKNNVINESSASRNDQPPQIAPYAWINLSVTKWYLRYLAFTTFILNAWH